MPTFLTSFQDWAAILGIAGWVVAGVFVLVGYFGQNNRARKEEADKLADGLINRLQQTVEQQAKDLEEMRTEMEEHTKTRDEEIRKLSDQLVHMQGRNAVLEDLFKGRDPAMQGFLKDAPRLVAVAEENNTLARNTSAAVLKLAEAMTQLVERVDGGHLSIT